MPKVVDSEQRRAELTRVTAGEIARVGLDGVTLREIARAGGWTTGIVSHYFVDKRDLLLATFRSRADAARDRIDVSLAGGASTARRHRRQRTAARRGGGAQLEGVAGLLGAAVGDPELSAAQQDRHRSFHRATAQALAAEQAAGRLRQELDVDHEARRLVAVLDGIAVQAVFEPQCWPAAVQRRVVAEHVATLSVRRAELAALRRRGTMDTDVVVLGTGAAGLVAALAAAEQGASVGLFEKGDVVGGTTALSGGLCWVPDNPQCVPRASPTAGTTPSPTSTRSRSA